MTKITDLNFSPDFKRAVQHFRTLEGYSSTALETLKTPSGLEILAKNETNRMGLGAFKALGGPYAIARLLLSEWSGQSDTRLAPEHFADQDFLSFAAKRTFVTASAGNHGLGVAAGARTFGAKARIYLAQTVPESFSARLEAQGAEVVRKGASYDDSVTEAIRDAEQTGATLLADGTWPGYTDIPKYVMEGYTVIAEELREAFETSGHWPTHVFLQAGVGGLAAAIAFMIRENWAVQPDIIVVEPEAATCLQASHTAGKPVRSDGPDSNMGRLDCKEPSIVAWHTLESCDVLYESLSEEEGSAAAEALRALGLPTTPSGAAGYGALMKHDRNRSSNAAFRPLIIVTECPDTQDKGQDNGSCT
ncbi:diaminopropionate ammonia-lyase [Kiloniella sp. b19]|uniref:diaminopropionate ammonia-lyase n=1 Tax=Kiloniella sp. GXU_MW_B19 TaxID=3141326 RepID=UPI0031D3AD0A